MSLNTARGHLINAHSGLVLRGVSPPKVANRRSNPEAMTVYDGASNPMMNNRSAFTLVEAMLASFIALYVILGGWGVSIMVWQWWKDTAPEIDSQRAARTAISVMIDGAPDATAGTFSANGVTYKRRNGIAWATYEPTIASPPSRINFRLAPDASNVRSFYMGTDAASGLNFMYYTDNNGVSTKIDATRGITNVTFEKYMGYDDAIKVTVTAGNASYSDVIFLRNIT